MRKVFLENLPKWEGTTNNNKINWNKSIGIPIKFIYEDIEGYVTILKVEKNKFTVHVDGYEDCVIDRAVFTRGGLGMVLKKITNDFRFEIGQTINNITITNRKIITEIREDKKCKNGKTTVNFKYYQYHCNKCGYDSQSYYKKGEYINEYWCLEKSIMDNFKNGCACCEGQLIVPGINDIKTKNPEIVKYFVNKDDAIKYAPTSKSKIIVKCPDCEREFLYPISQITILKHLPCNCNDNISYPEKFMFNLLNQLKVDFIWQLSHKTFIWCNDKKYDFYFKINNEEYIIETNGIQHYKQSSRKGARTLKEEQENDKNKYNLAIKNGIKPENYIVIDFRESTLEWGKEHILNSNLNKVFNLNNINWLECEKYCFTNIDKEICNYWNNKKQNETISYLCKIFKTSDKKIRDILKKGTKLGWCNYDANLEIEKHLQRSAKRNIEMFSKPIYMYDKNMNFINTFKSATWLSNHSKELFETYLCQTSISACCRKDKPQYKGFIFREEDYILNNDFEYVKKEALELIDKSGKSNKILVYDLDMNLIGEYESLNYLINNSIELLGIKLCKTGIKDTCDKKRNNYKNFIFKYKYTN